MPVAVVGAVTYPGTVPAVATGTDCAGAICLRTVCALVDLEGDMLSLDETGEVVGCNHATDPQPLHLQAIGAGEHSYW
jgi:hypothetical protein